MRMLTTNGSPAAKGKVRILPHGSNGRISSSRTSYSGVQVTSNETYKKYPIFLCPAETNSKVKFKNYALNDFNDIDVQLTPREMKRRRTVFRQPSRRFMVMDGEEAYKVNTDTSKWGKRHNDGFFLNVTYVAGNIQTRSWSSIPKAAWMNEFWGQALAR